MSRRFLLLALPLALAACASPAVEPVSTPPSTQPSTISSAPSSISSAPLAQNVTVEMTATANEPATVTIPNGGSVTFVNTGTTPLWPASAPHPTHTDYPEFDPKKPIQAGESWTFTFTRPGTWKYHDHLAFKTFGTIIVQ